MFRAHASPSEDVAVLSLVIVKQCESEILGLTDNVLPQCLAPKHCNQNA